jgi:sigma-B regulation protein RsbU (phosphoserine phosphatase)
MGKGISGAILMAAVRTALRAGSPLPTVAATVQSLAESTARNLEKAGAFVTLFHARLNLETGSLTYVDAGHGLALVLQADSSTKPLKRGGIPLGVLPDQVYRQRAATPGPGDALVVFSDGVLEVHPEMTDPEAANAILEGAMSAKGADGSADCRGDEQPPR